MLFDSVLLSSEYKFSLYKQPTVAVVMMGVLIDLQGAEYGVTAAEVDAVNAAFPRFEFISDVHDTLVQLCIQKPNSTYGT